MFGEGTVFDESKKKNQHIHQILPLRYFIPPFPFFFLSYLPTPGGKGRIQLLSLSTQFAEKPT